MAERGCIGERPLCRGEIKSETHDFHRQMTVKAGDSFAEATVQAVLSVKAVSIVVYGSTSSHGIGLLLVT